MANKPRQLNLDELRRLKWVLGGAMALVSLWTVFFLDVEALSLVGVATGLVLVALLWPTLPSRVPALAWKLMAPAIIVAEIFDFYFSADTLPVLMRLAILLVLYRAISYRRKREDLQLIVLGLFLVVVAGVLTVSLGFAFLLLLFTACALGFLFVINLIAAAENDFTRATENELAWTRLEWGVFLGRLRQVADWRLLLFASVLFATVVTMSGLLFLVIPRFELSTGFFLDKYITRKSRTGFTETVRFGEVTQLTQDDSVAMRVDVTDSSGLREAPYWRLVVLDEYTPEGFKMSAGLRAELASAQQTRQQFRGRASERTGHTAGGSWTFYVEPGVSRFLPLPGSYGVLRLRDPVPLQTSQTHRLAAFRTEPVAMSAFQLEGVEMTPKLLDENLPGLLKAAQEKGSPVLNQFRADPLHLMRGPKGPENEAVLERILATITGGVKLPAEEFARRATEWLQTRHAYALSVKLPAGAGRDDIVRWIDSNEPGFCEYFAAGFAVLARAAGHPARLIAGFRGGALNGFENYFMVRNSNAHAWVEIHDGVTGWQRVDPTPGANNLANEIEQAAGLQSHDSSWSARVDSLRVLWYRRIVNFDSRAQAQMLEQVKSFTTGSGAALRLRLAEFSQRLKAWVQRPWDVARLGKSGAGLLGAGGLLWCLGLALRWSWRRWRFVHRPEQVDPVRKAAGRLLARVPADSDPGRVRAELMRLRYGPRESWPEPRGVFRRAKKSLRK